MISDMASFHTAQSSRDGSQVPVGRQSQQLSRLEDRATSAVSSESQAQLRKPANMSLGSPVGAEAKRQGAVLMFGGTLSPADLAYLDEILDTHGLGGAIVAGMDPEPEGSTEAPTAIGGDERGNSADREAKLQLAVAVAEQMGMKCQRSTMPIGVARTDEFLRMLPTIGQTRQKPRHWSERDRLVVRLASSGTDRLRNRRVVVYGEEPDFVAGMVSLLLEAGLQLVLCASRGNAQQLRTTLENLTPELHARTSVIQAERFTEVESAVAAASPDVLVANREACSFAERAGIPFLCVGRPLCSRDNGRPMLHIGYRGALELLDRLEAAIDECGQNGNSSNS